MGEEVGNWSLWDPEFAYNTDAIRKAEIHAFPDNVIVRLGSRVAWNFVRLPEHPMKRRLHDRRLGFWDGAYGMPTESRHAPILRWRLEKKHPTLSRWEPIKPIVIYIDPATPPKWRPWIRRAIEAWQPAFEAAGFKRAVIAEHPPHDPDWSYDNVRHSASVLADREALVRWT